MQKKSAILNLLTLPKETKIIVNASFQTKIKEMTEDGFRQIHIILLKWGKFLGIKDMPNAEEIKMIVFFIKQNFGDLTLDEITNAFNLAIARKLSVDPNHYQNFSALYIGGILDAYKEYKISHIQLFRQKEMEEQERVLAEKNKPSKEELKEMRLNSLLTIWENYKTGEEEEVEWQVTAYYDILTDAGLITLSNDEKKDIAERAKAICLDEVQNSKKNPFQIQRFVKEITGHSPKTPSQKVVTRCKLLATQMYFDNLIRDGLDLREQLNLTEDDRFTPTAERGGESQVVEEV